MLIGVSTVAGAFSGDVLQAMAELNPRPIIMPLSNPTSKSECTFEAAVAATRGRMLFASGSPFPPCTYGGRTLHPAQVRHLVQGGGGGALLQAKGNLAACVCPACLLSPAAPLLAGQQRVHLPRCGPRRRADALQGDQASAARHGPCCKRARTRARPPRQATQGLTPAAHPPPSPPVPFALHCRSDDVFLVAAEALASMSSVAQLEQGHLFPAFAGIKAVSARLIAAVADFVVSLPARPASPSHVGCWEAGSPAGQGRVAGREAGHWAGLRASEGGAAHHACHSSGKWKAVAVGLQARASMPSP